MKYLLILGVALVVLGVVMVSHAVSDIDRGFAASQARAKQACQGLYAKARTPADSLVVAQTRISWDTDKCITYEIPAPSAQHQ